MNRKINVIEDLEGKKIVFIEDIIFKGKRHINWNEVEKYLKNYIGECYRVEDSNEIIYIGNDLPDEYTHSKYTKRLRGASAKAKANAAQGIPEMIEIANNEQYSQNKKEKHNKDAKYGWYYYDSMFALPVFGDDAEIERYNVFHVVLLIRHDEDGRKYLYDIMNIKKETSKLFQSKDLTQ